MPLTEPRTVHLHLVDISAGWHICRSFTTQEFIENRHTTIIGAADQPIDELVDLEIAAENFVSNAADQDIDAAHPLAMAGFIVFSSLLEARLSEEVAPHDYVGASGDWLLATVGPRAECSGPVILMTNCITRTDPAPLTGEALGHAVLGMLSRALPKDGAGLEMMDIHPRWGLTAKPAHLT